MKRGIIKTKKASEGMGVGLLVVIVLAILILVVLALGFGAGWGNFWSKITSFFGSANVDTVKQGCEFACSSNSQYDWCTKTRSMTYEEAGAKKTVTLTCDSWLQNKAKDKDKNEVPINVGVTPEACSTIACEQASQSDTCVGKGGGWYASPCLTGMTQLTVSDTPPVAGQVCCKSP